MTASSHRELLFFMIDEIVECDGLVDFIGEDPDGRMEGLSTP